MVLDIWSDQMETPAAASPSRLKSSFPKGRSVPLSATPGYLGSAEVSPVLVEPDGLTAP